MDMLKTMTMLEALKLELIKYDKIEDLKAQEVDSVFTFILEYSNVVLSRGMQHYLYDKYQKCSLVDLCEKKS
jgi:hypothetical protein